MTQISEPYVANLQKKIGKVKLARVPLIFAAGIGGALSGQPIYTLLALMVAYGAPTAYTELLQNKLIKEYTKKPNQQ